MSKIKYAIDQLPGERYYRDFFNNLESEMQVSYRFYQDWRMTLGILMQDIDALVSDHNIESFNSMKTIEYELNADQICQNYALLEMKHFRTSQETIDKIVNWSNPSKEIANTSKLPFFVVKYFPAPENNGRWEFVVYAANLHAKKIYDKPFHMSEHQFVQFLHALRGKTPSRELMNSMCREKTHNML